MNYVVSYVIVWVVVFYSLLPLGNLHLSKKAEKGMPPATPLTPNVGKKMIIASVISLLLFGFFTHFLDKYLLSLLG